MFAMNNVVISVRKISSQPNIWIQLNLANVVITKRICTGFSSLTKRFYSSIFSRTLTHSDRKIVPVPPDVMYNVVADVESYKEFVPWCTKSIVTAKNVKTAKAELSVGFGPIQENYKSTLIFNEPKYIKSICTDGKLFNMLDCTWKFSSGPASTTCIINFDVSFEFRSLMYSRLAKMFFDEVVIKMVNAFEKRALLKHKHLLLSEKKKL